MITKQGIKVANSYGPYNRFDDKEQWIRMSEGCPNKCKFCYDPHQERCFRVPQIIRNKVSIMDMNILSKPRSWVGAVLRNLAVKRVNGRVVYYNLVCGIDWRFLTPEYAEMIKSARIRVIRFAWDYGLSHVANMACTIEILEGVGFRRKCMEIFMVCNWEIPLVMCLKKLSQCFEWGVKVSDCYFDGQTMPNVEPIGWTRKEIKLFRGLVRKCNQLVIFNGFDPEFHLNDSDRYDGPWEDETPNKRS